MADDKDKGKTNTDKVKEWLDSQLSSKRKPDVVMLWHSSMANGGPPIRIFDLDETEGVVSSELAKQILQVARDDSSAHTGSQLYVLRSAKKDDDSGSLSQMMFRLSPADHTGIPSGDSAGIVLVHTLRQQEAFMRQVTVMLRDLAVAQKEVCGMYAESAKFSSGEVQLRNKRIAELEAKQSEVSKLIDELLTAKHERELETKRSEKEEARKDKIAGWLLTIAPGIVAKLFDKGTGSLLVTQNLLLQLTGEQKQKIADMLNKAQMMFLVDAMADPKKLADFMKSLDEQQIASLMGILTPEQILQLEKLSDLVDPQ